MHAIFALIAFVTWTACLGDTISVLEESAGTTSHRITVKTPGKLEGSFTRTNGFGKTWYDLKNDPGKLRNMGPIYTGGLIYSGFFWVKMNSPDMGGSYEPNGADTMQLLEANSVRTRIRLKGGFSYYGGGSPDWAGMFFEQIYTVYPNGSIYLAFTVESQTDQNYNHLAVITRSTGKWGPNGVNEVHPLGEYGSNMPYGRTAASWQMQYSNGPTYFQDILMVPQKGKWIGSYWNEGYLAEDYRTSFNMTGALGNGVITTGKHPLYFMMRFADDMNDTASANPYARDYRSPDTLVISQGVADKADRGDTDADGFNETEGCYVLTAGATGVRFTLNGTRVRRMSPSFKIKGWKWPTPSAILWGGALLQRGTDFNAALVNGSLVMQVLRNSIQGSVEAVVSGTGVAIRSSLPMPVGAPMAGTLKTFDLMGRKLNLAGQNAFIPTVRITGNNGSSIILRNEGGKVQSKAAEK